MDSCGFFRIHRIPEASYRILKDAERTPMDSWTVNVKKYIMMIPTVLHAGFVRVSRIPIYLKRIPKEFERVLKPFVWIPGEICKWCPRIQRELDVDY